MNLSMTSKEEHDRALTSDEFLKILKTSIPSSFRANVTTKNSHFIKLTEHQNSHIYYGVDTINHFNNSGKIDYCLLRIWKYRVSRTKEDRTKNDVYLYYNFDRTQPKFGEVVMRLRLISPTLVKEWIRGNSNGKITNI